mmetsp:Transcript_16510/g.25642  ORF Transcript_16510/g.25642 Transcript_16510/m.25642 type:complete len:212 (+) Transcript_16510:796-1431(+)
MLETGHRDQNSVSDTVAPDEASIPGGTSMVTGVLNPSDSQQLARQDDESGKLLHASVTAGQSRSGSFNRSWREGCGILTPTEGSTTARHVPQHAPASGTISPQKSVRQERCEAGVASTERPEAQSQVSQSCIVSEVRKQRHQSSTGVLLHSFTDCVRSPCPGSFTMAPAAEPAVKKTAPWGQSTRLAYFLVTAALARHANCASKRTEAVWR